jgi:exopolysaccharide production protein ExoQ
VKAIATFNRSESGTFLGFLLGDLQLFLLIFPFTSLFTAMPSLEGLTPVINGLSMGLIAFSLLYLVFSSRSSLDLAASAPLFIFLGLLILSMLWVHPAMKVNSLSVTLRTCLTVLQAFVVVKILLGQDRLFPVLKFFAVLITVLNFGFIILFPAQSNWIVEGVNRTQGFYSTPNNLGQFLGFAFLLINFYERKQFHIALLLILDAMIIYQLIKCDSVTSLTGIIVIVICFQFKKLFLPLFLTVVLAGLIIPNLSRILPGSASNTASIANRDLTFSGRTDVWNIMVKDLSAKNKMANGFGSGGYWINAAYDQDKHYNPWSTIDELEWQPGQGHNGYMDILVHTGIIGVVLFLAFLIQFIITLFRRISFEEQIVYFLTLIVLINNITESSFFREKHFYFVLLMVMYWYVFLKEEEEEPDPELAEE